jgi:hypothetical protein
MSDRPLLLLQDFDRSTVGEINKLITERRVALSHHVAAMSRVHLTFAHDAAKEVVEWLPEWMNRVIGKEHARVAQLPQAALGTMKAKLRSKLEEAPKWIENGVLSWNKWFHIGLEPFKCVGEEKETPRVSYLLQMRPYSYNSRFEVLELLRDLIDKHMLATLNERGLAKDKEARTRLGADLFTVSDHLRALMREYETLVEHSYTELADLTVLHEAKKRAEARNVWNSI